MNKYIDADLLRKEIEKERKNIDGLFTEGDNSFYDGQDDAYNHTLALINSLQYEQQEDLSSLIAKAQSVAKRLLDSHSFYEVLPEDIRYEHTAEKWRKILKAISSCSQQEQPEVDLEKFTEKMDAWKARYNHPDNIPIKATMAFTARMFYMYPQVAREWYDSLPKVSLD